MHDDTTPTRLAAADGPSQEPPPSTGFPDGQSAIGPYRLLQPLGRGGMGEVWLAEQTEPIRRKVALKIIKRGMDSDEVIGRFEAERQALAVMDHPCIARVFDAGTTDGGRPYFAMEYVAGVPITRYCDGKRLSTRERLELFARVCEGVQHAHQKAIIHRDLKPTNILVTEVDGRPAPKIIDFGLAKATERRLGDGGELTELGQLVGTPEYMSPEQMEISSADIDTRTDVYSLGVVLYVLLTGTLPFGSRELRASGFDGMRRTIREVDPPTPSTRLSSLRAESGTIAEARGLDSARLRRRLRGDLDWITMKALEKDRDRRYETASALAVDIRRHLADEPVLAGPPGTAYRVGKLIRRNKGAFAAVAAVFAALVLGVTAATWGLVRSQRAEREAARAAESTQAVNDFLNRDLLAAVAPSSAKGRGKDVLMRDVLDAAAENIDAASAPGGRFAERPWVEADIRLTLGDTYRLLGEYEPAEKNLTRAVELREEASGPEDAGLAEALFSLGVLYGEQGRYDEAIPLVERARNIVLKTAGEDAPVAVDYTNRLAILSSRSGNTDEAERMFLDALRRQVALHGEDDPMARDIESALANMYQTLGRFSEAESLDVRGLEWRRRVNGDEDVNTIGAMNNLANVYASQGRFDEAMPLWQRALELKTKVMGPDHPSTLNTRNNLAEAAEILGDYAAADTLHAQVLEARRRVLGPEHHDTLRSQARQAFVLGKLGRTEEAEAMARQAVDVLDRTKGPAFWVTIEAEDVLGYILMGQGRLTEAEPIFRRLRDTLARETPDDEFSIALVGAHLGATLAKEGKRAEAESLLVASIPGINDGGVEQDYLTGILADMYDDWDRAEPGKGYGDRAADWRARTEQGAR